MKNFRLPPGYSFIQSMWRTYKQVKDPIGAMEERNRSLPKTEPQDSSDSRLQP